MMLAVEKRFGANGKPPKTIEWLTDNGSWYTATQSKSYIYVEDVIDAMLLVHIKFS